MIRRLLPSALAAVGFVTPVAAQDKPADKPADKTWDVTLARGKTREIDFTTSEGTWMTVDASPDGSWIVFDLLGHVYRMPATGGEATVLTQNTGVAVNYQPRLSPDGSLIAFISDRKGQNNLWVMNADGSNPRAIYTDPAAQAAQPAWSPDGQYLYVQRPGSQGGPGGIWMYHKDGGAGVEILSAKAQPGASWPAPSADGRYLYFQVFTGAGMGEYPGRADFLSGAAQVRRLDLRTGEIAAISSGEQNQQVQSSSGGMAAPEVSPDGKWLAFARRIPDGTISWKGHTFGPRTALWLRNLANGQERLLVDPIELDMVETFKVTRPLPGYSWSRDGKTITIAQGGKLVRVDVASGAVTPIPFTAKVHRTISEQANTQGRLTDDPFTVKFARWQTASPDGKTLVFQALGRLWTMALPNGTPKRLTAEGFGPFEYAPAWSPDGQWIAFTSWDDAVGGHLWKIRAAGGAPEQLTRAAGEYVHPAWSPDGREIVVAQGAGETGHGRGLLWNPWFDLVRVPAASGEATPVVRVTLTPDGSGGAAFNAIRSQIVRPTWLPNGRIYYPHTGTGETTLYSIRPDGLDRRAHLTFPFADEASPSPDARWVAFQESDNVYVTPLPAGTGATPVKIDRNRSNLPVTKLSTTGGLFPRWRDAGTVEFGSGNQYYAWHQATQKTDTVAIVLTTKRDVPSGTVAFTGARIVTLAGRKVVNGTLVVTGSRITCVGSCAIPKGARTISASGKTIIPGFIDVHSHNYREHRGIIPQHNYEGAVFLAYGITSTMDPSMWSQNLFPTAEMVDAGVIVGPRVFTTGDPLYAGDGLRQEDFTSYEAAEAGIRKLQNWGAVSLKQYMQPRREQRQWVSDIARKVGIQVTSENDDLEYTLGLIMDGQTGFEHPLSYLPLYGDATTFLGKARATYSPTFMVGGAGPWNEEYWYSQSETWKDPKLRRWMPWRQQIPQSRRRMLRPATDYSYPFIAQSLKDLIAAGGYGAIGAHGQHNGPGSHWEVWMAASALGPMGALEIASPHAARFIGREQDLGTLEPGKLADFMVLNSNPLENIRNTLDIQYVTKGGVVYLSDTLDEVWPQQRKYGNYFWVNPDALKADDRPLH